MKLIGMLPVGKKVFVDGRTVELTHDALEAWANRQGDSERTTIIVGGGEGQDIFSDSDVFAWCERAQMSKAGVLLYAEGPASKYTDDTSALGAKFRVHDPVKILGAHRVDRLVQAGHWRSAPTGGVGLDIARLNMQYTPIVPGAHWRT